MDKLIFVDSEIDSKGRICDLGAVKENGAEFHSPDTSKFKAFMKGSSFIAGHNIVHFDAKYIANYFDRGYELIDTLYVSPLMFPEKPYHKLVKDEKIISEEVNNPLADSKKCRDLFYDEVNAFDKLDKSLKSIYGTLLYKFTEFSGFFDYVKWKKALFLKNEIKTYFHPMICENADLGRIINNNPVELAYALAIISVSDRPNGRESITPAWVLKNYPKTEMIIKELRGTPCDTCDYCKKKFNSKLRLKDIFGYDNFREFNGEKLQEKAVDAAIRGKSELVIFPTGGGKSITFQLPALIAGETEHGLTIVISPLQSLMKDQVDNLEKKGSADAVTINGMLSPVERAEAIERVRNGKASILYIAPESLRSTTIEKILLERNISRFVIDEAHCFSSWGQDFRVDYQYIGDFINRIVEKKGLGNIPVSCFTATAKQKVVSDIQDYFKEKCGLSLELFATSVERSNLTYKVIPKNNDDEKYQTLRDLIEEKKCPTVVFVSSVAETIKISSHLEQDGFKALPFNGQMERQEKIENQNAFMNNECQIMVATNAFGMGVDKGDIKLVIHYDISDSLENYIQEAGRAGRDQSLQAECYVLFCEDDLNKHFLLLNQTKLTIREIQQVWQAIKKLSKNRTTITNSALEIAREAGWDDGIKDIETRVKTAINALETSGYVQRGMNSPRVFATSIMAKNLIEAKDKAIKSNLFEEEEIQNVTRILSSLISARSVKKASGDDAEDRVDYIADRLGIDKFKVISIINRLRQAKVLSDENDMTATLNKGDSLSKVTKIVDRFAELERFLIKTIKFESEKINLKELNENAMNEGIKNSSVKSIKMIFMYWTIKGYIQKNISIANDDYQFHPLFTKNEIEKKIEDRLDLAYFITEYLLKKTKGNKEIETVGFSVVELLNNYNDQNTLLSEGRKCNVAAVQDALLYLSKIGAMNLEGGFLVLYSGMRITRLVTNNTLKYKKEDYKELDNFYKLRIQQIHIVGEYANMMVKSYEDALGFVNDYFSMEYDGFIKKYFKGNKKGEIQRNITPKKYEMLFGCLSETQKLIIDDEENNYISVIAGPGSGKTRVLVHKLASLLLLEDIKAEQLLMLTFSRAAATEFKSRLIDLIKSAAFYVDIKTFHSYCFDLLGKNGNEDEFENVIEAATSMIEAEEVENEKITKSVLVIDEAQDMDEKEFQLVNALIKRNPDMRIIAVGDDDQNIYEFRGSSSKYLQSFITELGARRYELIENYRSTSKIVNLANAFGKTIHERLKINPIIAIRKDDGRAVIVKHSSENMEEAIALDIIKNNYKNQTAILTNTNNEALRMLGVLTKHNIKARLIQSSDDFMLYNLAEIRFFIKHISKVDNPIISKSDWMEAKQHLINYYNTSSIIDVVLKMLDTFEKINTNLYMSDFIEYIKEAHYEDFLFDKNEKVIVSTIHKAKGHEFDNVYMMLADPHIGNDAEKRKIYVGLTRAKNELHIHVNNAVFDRFKYIDGTEYYLDNKDYPNPEEISIQLSYRDVVLDFFKNKKNYILSARAGEKLEINDVYLMYGTQYVVKLSSTFRNTVDNLRKSGYEMTSAEIRFIVAWKGEEDETESAVILPTIYFKYNKDLIESSSVSGETNNYLETPEIKEKVSALKQVEQYNFITGILTDLLLNYPKIESQTSARNRIYDSFIKNDYIFHDEHGYHIKDKGKSIGIIENISENGHSTLKYNDDAVNEMKKILSEFQSELSSETNIDDKKKVRNKVELPDTELVRLLKQYRMAMAKKKDVSAFVIFSDASLKSILDIMPKTKEEFLKVNGFGETKYNLYGKDIMDIIKEYSEKEKN